MPNGYDYAHVPTIRQFSRSNARVRGIVGPFGSGKSSGCVIEIPRRAQGQLPSPDGIRRTRFAVVRNTYRQLKDTTIKTFFHWFPPGQWGQWFKQEMRYEMRLDRETETEVLFRALDRPDQVGNLLSLELTGAWINEARETPLQIIDAMDGRINRYPAMEDGGATWAGIWMDTNPPDLDSWWYDSFEDNPKLNWEVFRQPSGLSPEAENLPNLPHGYYQDLTNGKSKQWTAIYVEGKYGAVAEGMAIYRAEWNEQLHLADKPLEPDPGLPLLIGYDFGLMPAAVIAQLTPLGQLRVLDEVCGNDLGFRRLYTSGIHPLLATKYRGYKIIWGSGDPSGSARHETDERCAFDVVRECGLPVEAAYSNAEKTRWEAVRWFLTRLADGMPAFLLSPTCRLLRRGFNGSYHLRKVYITGLERYEQHAFKNEVSHPHDALQYLCMRAKTDGYTSDPTPEELEPEVAEDY